MRYAVVVEQARENLSAYVPDLPGCVATGSDRKAVLQAIREAVEMHLAGMAEDGRDLREFYVASCGDAAF